jgi:hypothetical protein
VIFDSCCSSNGTVEHSYHARPGSGCARRKASEQNSGNGLDAARGERSQPIVPAQPNMKTGWQDVAHGQARGPKAHLAQLSCIYNYGSLRSNPSSPLLPLPPPDPPHPRDPLPLLRCCRSLLPRHPTNPSRSLPLLVCCRPLLIHCILFSLARDPCTWRHRW